MLMGFINQLITGGHHFVQRRSPKPLFLLVSTEKATNKVPGVEKDALKFRAPESHIFPGNCWPRILNFDFETIVRDNLGPQHWGFDHLLIKGQSLYDWSSSGFYPPRNVYKVAPQ